MNIHRVESMNLDSIKSMDTKVSALPVKTLASGSSENSKEGTFDYHSLSEKEKTKLDKQIEELNKAIAESGKELHFKYNDKAKQLYVEVLNSKTKEVLSSLPPEFLIDLSIKMKEMVGMFIDEKI